MATINEDLAVAGTIKAGNGFRPLFPRTQFAQEALAPYPIIWTAWRVWNALQTNLPGTPLTDDLGLVGGTFGSASPSIRTEDLKAAGATTSYARAQVRLPPEYEAGETVTLRFHAGMITSEADNAATLDVEAYKADGESGVGSDLYSGSAQDINDLTHIDVDFNLTPTLLEPGDLLDIRIAIAVNDAATGTAVIAAIGAASLLCDIRG